MYDRAIEMSRSAAINEIANQDLPGCEISYITAIRMLEAVLEKDEDESQRKSSGNHTSEKEAEDPINGINISDRDAVNKRKSNHPHLSLVRHANKSQSSP
jgi:serine/threonine-protein kinase ULK/ATG1